MKHDERLVEHEPGVLPERVGPSAGQVIRGVGGTGLVWGGLWAGLGGIVALGASIILGAPLQAVLPTAVGWGAFGVLSGAAFASVLTTMERRRALDDLSLVRVGAWGATGAFAVAFGVLVAVGAASFFGFGWAALQGAQAGVLGALSAVGTTWLAKSAADDGEPHTPNG